jgi:tRNA dimethylallyltransferase
MYLRGLLRGIVPAPPRDPELRERLSALARRRGNARLHRLLARLDPESARRLPPGDTQRIVRALEMALAGEGTWSAALASRGTWTSGGDRYPTLKVGLDLDRELLARRLDARVDAFFDAGLVEEVRSLLAGGVPPAANAFKAIGYREVEAAIAAGTDPESARAEIMASTRRFATRQRTWFRREQDVVWLDAAEGPDALAARVASLWEKRG